MALKPKLRPAPCAMRPDAVTRALFKATRKGLQLVTLRLFADRLGDGLVLRFENSNDAIEVEQDRILDAGRLPGDDGGKPALDEQRPHAFEVAGHVGKAETAAPEGGKTRARPLGRLTERLAELLVAHELDAPAERLEQFERHVLRRPVERIVRAGGQKRLAVSRALAPILGDGDGDPLDTRRDAQGESAAKTGLRVAARQGLGAFAVEKIFERGQALERDALLYKPVRRGDRLSSFLRSALCT